RTRRAATAARTTGRRGSPWHRDRPSRKIARACLRRPLDLVFGQALAVALPTHGGDLVLPAPGPERRFDLMGIVRHGGHALYGEDRPITDRGGAPGIFGAIFPFQQAHDATGPFHMYFHGL